MTIEKRLADLGLELPEPPAPAANYIPWLVTDKLVFFAGQTPKEGTALKYAGQVGTELSVEQGYEAAKLCAMRLLSALQEAANGLDNVKRIVKLTVFVSSLPDFKDHASVGNGASDLICAVFGNAGVHVRSAVGSSSLPGNAAVEVEMIAQLK
jgi:enamine deaminase RidA (YjgF/YER057c/UK114 family)